MKALILNSGLGHRMGDITKEHPKCMTEIDNSETIIHICINCNYNFISINNYEYN